MESYDESENPAFQPFGNVFKAVYVGLTQVVGIVLVVLAACWLGNYCGGFAWTSASLIFNYHPLFMLVGMVLLFGNALTVHRIFREMKLKAVKLLHASLLVLSLVFVTVALIAVFTASNMAGWTNFYSLHSWIGLMTLILFVMQWIAGLVILLLRRTGHLMRMHYKPLHSFFGIVIFVLAVATALLGMFEYVELVTGDQYFQLGGPAVLVNFMGLLLIVFAGMIVFHLTSKRFRSPNATAANDKEFSQLAR